jgi:hypothetical protein
MPLKRKDGGWTVKTLSGNDPDEFQAQVIHATITSDAARMLDPDSETLFTTDDEFGRHESIYNALIEENKVRMGIAEATLAAVDWIKSNVQTFNLLARAKSN